MEEDGKFRVEQFNDHNYQLWKMKMEDYLHQKYLYLPFGEKANKPTSMTNEELGTTWMCLVVSVDFNLSKDKTIIDLMNALEKLYEKPSTSNKVFLMKRLFNIKMS